MSVHSNIRIPKGTGPGGKKAKKAKKPRRFFKKKKGCITAPVMSDGKNSELYVDLFNLAKKRGASPVEARQITNVLYSFYVTDPTIASTLTAGGKRTNSQNQHSAKDVFDILSGEELVKFNNANILQNFLLTEGIKINNADYKDFDTWQEAYQVADELNDKNPMISARVVREGGKYQVKASPVTTANMAGRPDTKLFYQEMQLIETAMSSKGLELSRLDEFADTFYGSNYSILVDWLRRMPSTANKYLDKRDLKMLLSLSDSERIVQRMITRFGDVDTLVDTLHDWAKGITTASASDEARFISLMDTIKNLKGLDTRQLARDSVDLKNNIKKSTTEYKVKDAFNALNKNLALSKEAIEVDAKKIQSVVDAITLSIFNLNNHIKDLKTTEEDSVLIENLSNIESILTRELETSMYLGGMAEMIQEINRKLNEVLDTLKNNVITESTDLTEITQMASDFVEAQDLRTLYEGILERLSTATELVEDDLQISQASKRELEAFAQEAKKTLSKVQLQLDQGIELWNRQAISEMMLDGSELTIDEIMETITKDPSFGGKIVNPATIANIPAAVLYAFLVRQRNARVDKLLEADKELQDIFSDDGSYATALQGNNKKFFEKVGDQWFIKSEYDWTKYFSLKEEYIKYLRSNGYKGEDFKVALDKWILTNTDEVPIAPGSSILHRVPIFKKSGDFMKDFSPRERKLYYRCLEFKAKYEQLIPSYERDLYKPVQVRKSALDHRNPLKMIKEKWLQWFKERNSDESFYSRSVSTDDGNLLPVHNLDKTGKKKIPIEYRESLENQNDLNFNLREQLIHLAATAINYDAMSNIQDTIELLSQQIEQRVGVTKKGYTTAQVVNKANTTLYKKTRKKASNIQAIMDDWKDRLLYNDHSMGMDIRWAKKIAFAKKFTSVTALSFNLFGAANNRIEGMSKNIEEAFVANTDSFSPKDLLYGVTRIFFQNVLKSPLHIFDYFTGKKRSFDAIIHRYFDPKADKFHQITHRKYRTNFFRQALSTDLTFIGYQVGETMNNMPITSARLYNVKVYLPGKKNAVSLWKAFDKAKTIQAGRPVLKDGVILKSTGELVTQEVLERERMKMQEISEHNHGGMSDQAQGQIASTVLGAMTLQLRRWMIGVYSEYLRGEHYNALTGKKKTGAYKGVYDVTLNPIITALKDNMHDMPWSKEFLLDLRDCARDIVLNYKNLKKDTYKWRAVCRFFTGAAKMFILSKAVDFMLAGLFPKFKDDEWFKLLYYFIARQKIDTGAIVFDFNHIERFASIPENLLNVFSNPYSVAGTANKLVKIGAAYEYKDEIVEQGPFEGMNKFEAQLHKTIPHNVTWERIQSVITPGDNTLLESLGGMRKYSMEKEYERLTGAPREKSAEEKRQEREERKKKRKESAKKKKERKANEEPREGHMDAVDRWLQDMI